MRNTNYVLRRRRDRSASTFESQISSVAIFGDCHSRDGYTGRYPFTTFDASRYIVEGLLGAGHTGSAVYRRLMVPSAINGAMGPPPPVRLPSHYSTLSWRPVGATC